MECLRYPFLHIVEGRVLVLLVHSNSLSGEGEIGPATICLEHDIIFHWIETITCQMLSGEGGESKFIRVNAFCCNRYIDTTALQVCRIFSSTNTSFFTHPLSFPQMQIVFTRYGNKTEVLTTSAFVAALYREFVTVNNRLAVQVGRIAEKNKPHNVVPLFADRNVHTIL